MYNNTNIDIRIKNMQTNQKEVTEAPPRGGKTKYMYDIQSYSTTYNICQS